MNQSSAKLERAGPKMAVAAFFVLLSVTLVRAAVLTGSLGSHDPSRMINCGGTYYVYSTGGGMKYSTDRINWSSGTSPFPSGVPSSVSTLLPSNQGIWAPDVLFYNNQYYMYYAVAASSGDNCAIGLQTSPTLNTSASNYKWTDVGVVILSESTTTQRSAIDPCPFLDTSNNLWLSWGSGYADGAGYYTNTIFVSRLNNTTGLSVSPADTNGTTVVATLTNEFGIVPGHIEASFVYYRNGYYYVFWNSGGCCSGSDSTYTIHMARSTNVIGPYYDESGNATENLGGTTFLGPTATLNNIIGEEDGPGQIGILSEGGMDRFTYHYYPLSGGADGGADLGEETLIWGANGWPTAGADLAAGTYKISSLNNGLVMGVNQASTTEGTALDQETYTGSAYQQWNVAYTTNGSSADGYYNITSPGSGLVVDLYQSNTNNGTLIDQWPWGNGNNQRWLAEQTSEGYYRIVSRVSLSVIDVTNFSDASGTWLDERGWSNTVNQQWVIGTTSGTPPAPPTGLAATPENGQVYLSWTAVTGATEYDVNRGTISGGPCATSAGISTASNFTDTGVTNGGIYYYTVSAVNASGVSTQSLQVSASPGGIPTPLGLTATAGNGQVSLTWTAVSGVTSYHVKRSTTNGGPFVTTNNVSSGANYADTSVTDGTTYYYAVSAVTLNGEGPNSIQASATPTAAFPPPPAGSTNLTWTGSASGSWDVNTTGNWLVSGTISPATTFQSGDSVNFDDSSSVTSISLAGSVQPYILTVNASQNYTFNGGTGSLAGPALLVKCGAGTLTLNGTNTFTDGIINNNGSLILGSTGANISGLGAGPITFNGGTLQYCGYGGSGGTDWGGCTNTLSVPAGQTGTLLLPPRFGYTTPFTSALTGGGTLYVTVDYVRDYLSGNWSAFTGLINVSPRSGTGDFRINNVNGYANAAFYLNSGVNFYVINNNGLTVDLGELGGVSGAIVGAGNSSSSNPTFRIGAKNTTNTFAGTIEDSGTTTLIKVGTGTLILTGANTYSGGTTVSGGVLLVNTTSGSGTGAGTVTVAGGGTLSGAGIISGAVTVNSAGTLAPANMPAALTISNNLTLASGSTNFFEINSGTQGNDAVTLSGALAEGGTLVITNVGAGVFVAGDSFKLFTAASFSGAFANIILPSLPAGLLWNTNTLKTNGILAVVQAPPNTPPVLAAVANKIIAAGTTLTYTNMATDTDQPPQTLTFSLPAAPVGAGIGPATGIFSWTPTSGQYGTTNPVTVMVTDNGTPPLSATQSFSVIVLLPNTPPVLAPIPSLTIAAGATLTYTNMATDTDQPPQTLTFSLPVAPTGATITPATGVFSWTPSSVQYGTTNPVTVVVTDNGTPNLGATQSFDAIVLQPNPPVIGGLSMSGNGLVFSGGGGVPGANFYLMGTTNLAMPMSGWTPLLTNQFDNNGNFNFTNPMNTSQSQSFYLLRLQ